MYALTYPLYNSSSNKGPLKGCSLFMGYLWRITSSKFHIVYYTHDCRHGPYWRCAPFHVPQCWPHMLYPTRCPVSTHLQNYSCTSLQLVLFLRCSHLSQYHCKMHSKITILSIVMILLTWSTLHYQIAQVQVSGGHGSYPVKYPGLTLQQSSLAEPKFVHQSEPPLYRSWHTSMIKAGQWSVCTVKITQLTKSTILAISIVCRLVCVRFSPCAMYYMEKK